jgi:hypothetical protein
MSILGKLMIRSEPYVKEAKKEAFETMERYFKKKNNCLD